MKAKTAKPLAKAPKARKSSTPTTAPTRKPPEAAKASRDPKTHKTAAGKPAAKATPASVKKPGTKPPKASGSEKASHTGKHSATAPKSSTKKAGIGDRSELLRRLLEVRSGYQRAQDSPVAAKKRPKTPERPVVRPLKPSTEPIILAAKPKPAPAPRPKFKKRDLERLEKALQAERDQMLHDLEILDEMTNAKGEGGAPESNVFSIHLAEHATDNSTLETTLMQRHLIEERLSQVLEALKRIEEGTFGLCELCSNAISVERLLAKPFARLCIDCRRDLERKRLRAV